MTLFWGYTINLSIKNKGFSCSLRQSRIITKNYNFLKKINSCVTGTGPTHKLRVNSVTIPINSPSQKLIRTRDSSHVGVIWIFTASFFIPLTNGLMKSYFHPFSNNSWMVPLSHCCDMLILRNEQSSHHVKLCSIACLCQTVSQSHAKFPFMPCHKCDTTSHDHRDVGKAAAVAEECHDQN